MSLHQRFKSFTFLHHIASSIVLPDALHSIRSLINIVTNETPHERLFNYQRKSATGYSVPTWLSEPGKVLLKRFVKNSKYDPDLIEVELLEANPQYAYIKYPNGRESTVSLRHLAPIERNESASKNETNDFTTSKGKPCNSRSP